MPLTDEQIKELLEAKSRKSTGVKSVTNHPRPIQLGPLSWRDDSMRCAQRGCGSPTMMKVRGIPYCISHALTHLNRIVAVEVDHIDLETCTCNAGTYSNGNIHTVDCTLYQLNKPQEIEAA